MRNVLAVLIAIIGIAASAYFGLAVMFVGGIEQIVDQINAATVDGGEVAWGIVRIVFASASFAVGMWISIGLAWLVGDWK